METPIQVIQSRWHCMSKGCDYRTNFEGGAIHHSKTMGHSVTDSPEVVEND